MHRTLNTFTLPDVKLNQSRSIKKEYIGLVMDVLNHYLQYNSSIYHIDFGPIVDSRKVMMQKDDTGSNIEIFKIGHSSYQVYLVLGFPETHDFEDFKSKAPYLFRKYLKEV
jgi:hypothetical protein